MRLGYIPGTLDHAYMQWGTCQQRPPCARVLFDFPHEDRVHVFQAMAFIHDDLTPVILCKVNTVLDDHLVGCNNYRKWRQLSGRVRIVIIRCIQLVATILVFDNGNAFFVRTRATITS